jgi:hypothetical protein
MANESYKFTFVDTLVGPQILSEVMMLHVLKNEAQWVFESRVHADEGHNVLVPKATTCQRLITEPLPAGCQIREHFE